MDALIWCIWGRKRGRLGATAGEPVQATSLWGMLKADDARVVSQSSE